NLFLLFWLSLVPFVTGWMGENHFDALPTAIYGVVLFMAGVAYQILQRLIIADQGTGSKLRDMVGMDVKGKTSAALYAVAIAIAFLSHWVSLGIYVLVALIWLAPDPRIEAKLQSEEG